MKHVAMVLLFDRDNRLFVYLRDNKPEIPFPDHWDLFGGHVEDGETARSLTTLSVPDSGRGKKASVDESAKNTHF